MGLGGSSPIGLNEEPYENPAYNIPGFISAQVRYGFANGFGLGGFINRGIIPKIFTSGEGGSDFIQYGLRPGIKLFESKDGRADFELALPVSFWKEGVEWNNGEGNSAANKLYTNGRDRATYFRIALAPCFRFNTFNSKVIYGVEAYVNWDSLRSSSRTIYHEGMDNSFSKVPKDYYQFSVNIHASIGYSF